MITAADLGSSHLSDSNSDSLTFSRHDNNLGANIDIVIIS